MSYASRVGLMLLFVGAGVGTTAVSLDAQNAEPNPYRTLPGVWAPLPDGREWGSTSLVEVSPDGETIWAVDRCGENNCVGHDDLDVVFQFDKRGRILTQFGAGMFEWPHGIDVDDDGNIYVCDWGNERVQVLDADGRFMQQLRGEATHSKWAEDFLGINVEEADARARANLEPDIEFFNDDPHEQSSHIEKLFWGPSSVILDPQGRLYVTETHRHRLQVYQRVD